MLRVTARRVSRPLMIFAVAFGVTLINIDISLLNGFGTSLHSSHGIEVFQNPCYTTRLRLPQGKNVEPLMPMLSTYVMALRQQTGVERRLDLGIVLANSALGYHWCASLLNASTDAETTNSSPR